jgi:predicted phosphate transport protein (TIGR00153 family)
MGAASNASSMPVCWTNEVLIKIERNANIPAQFPFGGPTEGDLQVFRLNHAHLQFYDLFDRSAEILVRAADRFHAHLQHFDHPERNAEEIKRYEHEADQVTHHGLELLHQAFVTPIDRPEIHRLIESLDDVLDRMDDAARRLVLYEISDMLPEAIELAAVLVAVTRVLQTSVADLRNLRRKSGAIRTQCAEVRRLENEGDRIQHVALARLFKSDLSPFFVLKWKEILLDIESAIDRCQDVADVLDGIVIENT